MNDKWEAIFQTGDTSNYVKNHPVAYFCAEYAFKDNISAYAGGLGVLAGDYIHEVANNGFPLVAVGLAYKHGRRAENIATHSLPFATNESGERVVVVVPIGNSFVYVSARVYEEGAVSVYFLDCDIDENDAGDRVITDALYAEDRLTRLKQEIILGIGGFRVLEVLGIKPSIYHLNEGHSAFLVLELTRHEMEHKGVDFEQGYSFAKSHIVFTNHTLVPAGQERFGNDMIRNCFSAYVRLLKIDTDILISLGSEELSGDFSMTLFALNSSLHSNGVSCLHTEKAQEIWPTHHIINVTNGIHISNWDMLATDVVGEIIGRHAERKQLLIERVQSEIGVRWDKNDLIIGWARRIVSYKRPLAILENAEGLRKIIKDTGRQIRLVFSGPSSKHEDISGELESILHEKLSTEFSDIAVFLPKYSIVEARLIESGSDVWLNTPIVGREACGTSGMKAGLNGVLSLTTDDGWVNEVEGDLIGWKIEDEPINEKVLAVLRESVIPQFDEYLKNGEESLWLKKMISARSLIKSSYSASRMFEDYARLVYLPTLQNIHGR